jgi:integrase
MRDDEEIRLLKQFRDPTVRTSVEVLLHTAIRPQAALQLRWQHVDLKRATISVTQEINKTHAYVVYVNSRVEEILRALYAQRPDALRQPDSLIFAQRNGAERRSIRTAWSRACSAGGIQGLHVRGLRATAATRLQEGGANTLDVAAHLGHSARSLSVTARYVDPAEGHRRKMAELTIRHRPSNVVELHARRPEQDRASTTQAASGTI